MAKDIIKYADFKGYVIEHQIAGSFGKGDNKKIICEVNVTNKEVKFCVYDHGNLMIVANNINDAIQIYNDFKLG